MLKKSVMTAGILAACISLAACGQGGKNPSAGGQTNGKMPTITWYLRYDEQKDEQKIHEEMNRITQEKIGANLNIKTIASGDYAEKMKLIMASNEKFDLCHMAPRYDFYAHVSKGAFKPLDDLITQYAPKTYEQIPEEFWEAAKVDGKLYGVLNYQIVGRQQGFVVQKALLEKYNFDLGSVKKLEDIEPFLQQLKENEPSNMMIFANTGGTYGWALTHYVGMDTIGSTSYPGAVRANTDDYTVVNQYATEEFMNFCKLMRDWYQKGYIVKDAPTVTNFNDLKQQGLVAVFLDNVAPGYEPQFAKQLGDRPVETVVIDPPFVNTENVIATMNCVSRTSQNPEKALEFLDLMNTDAEGIYNLMCFGIEGTHYKKLSDTRIEKIKDSGYDPNAAWMFGNNFNAYLIPGQEDGLWEETKELNDNATASKLLGFSLNTEPIKIELAQCEAVVSEYLDSITTGSVDPEEYIPQFLDKLEKANVDKIIEEEQRQVDEWLKTKTK